MQPALFGPPDDPAPPPARKVPTSGVWGRYAGSRRLCDACIELIHSLGVAGAPPPRVATQVLRTPEGTHHYCNPHKHQIRGASENRRGDRRGDA